MNMNILLRKGHIPFTPSRLAAFSKALKAKMALPGGYKPWLEKVMDVNLDDKALIKEIEPMVKEMFKVEAQGAQEAHDEGGATAHTTSEAPPPPPATTKAPPPPPPPAGAAPKKK